MNDSQIARLLSRSVAPEPRRGWRCPDASRWVAFVAARVDARERAGLEAHLSGCSHCLGQVAFLARAGDLGACPPVPGRLLDAARAGPAPLPPLWRPALAPLAGAATLVLALALLLPRDLVAPARDPAENEERALRGLSIPLASDGASARAPSLVRPFEGEVVAPRGLEIAWREAPDALFYTVQLLDARGDLVWEGTAAGTRLALPADLELHSGQSLYVWVVAHSRAGELVRSPVIRVRVAPH